MMNLDGSGLEQVTNFGGFTSFPGVFAGWQDAGVLLGQGRQGAVRVQYLHGEVEVGRALLAGCP